MPAVRTHQDITIYSINALSWIAEGRAFNFRGSLTNDEHMPINDSYQNPIAVKRARSFDFELGASDGPGTGAQTNLNVEVFTVDGKDMLTVGVLRSGSIQVRNRTDEASLVRDFDSFQQALVTEISLSGTMQIPDAGHADLLIEAMAAGAGSADQAVAYAMRVGDVTTPMANITGNMALEELSHAANRGAIQEYTFRGSNKGTPTATGHSLFVDAIAGDAVVAFDINTGGGRYTSGTGNGLITALGVDIRDGAIVRVTGTIHMNGAALITTT